MTHPYASSAYAEALAGLGRPVEIIDWGAYAHRRLIARSGAEDAMGTYPRSPLPSASRLIGGLKQLRSAGLVSLVVVPDPFASPGQEELSSVFEVCRAFKTHAAIDLRAGYAPSKHHRDRIRRGRRRCRIEEVVLADNLEVWIDLYRGLVRRHDIVGVAAFPDAYFHALAAIEEFKAFAAYIDDEIVGMTLWFEHDGVARSHLTATNAAGYSNGANYALNDVAIEHYAAADFIDLGGGAGHVDDPEDGLFLFKQGFANHHRFAFLCGAVLDRAIYEQLSAGLTSSFFPAYRAPA